MSDIEKIMEIKVKSLRKSIDSCLTEDEKKDSQWKVYGQNEYYPLADRGERK
jgi:hypothetical protein